LKVICVQYLIKLISLVFYQCICLSIYLSMFVCKTFVVDSSCALGKIGPKNLQTRCYMPNAKAHTAFVRRGWIFACNLFDGMRTKQLF